MLAQQATKNAGIFLRRARAGRSSVAKLASIETCLRVHLQLIAVDKECATQRTHTTSLCTTTTTGACIQAGRRGALLTHLELLVETLLLTQQVKRGALERVQARVDRAHERDNSFELLLQEHDSIDIEHGRYRSGSNSRHVADRRRHRCRRRGERDCSRWRQGRRRGGRVTKNDGFDSSWQFRQWHRRCL